MTIDSPLVRAIADLENYRETITECINTLRKLVDGPTETPSLSEKKTEPAAKDSHPTKPTGKMRHYPTILDLVTILKGSSTPLSVFAIQNQLKAKLGVSCSEDALKNRIVMAKTHGKIKEAQPGFWEIKS
jgi:hypothetical protein